MFPYLISNNFIHYVNGTTCNVLTSSGVLERFLTLVLEGSGLSEVRATLSGSHSAPDNEMPEQTVPSKRSPKRKKTQLEKTSVEGRDSRNGK